MAARNEALEEVVSSCHSILEKVRETRWNYAIQETPFTNNITARKSLNQSQRNPSSFYQHPVKPSVDSIKTEGDQVSNLKKRINHLENANMNLKNNFFTMDI